jgi:hypothetical protein
MFTNFAEKEAAFIISLKWNEEGFTPEKSVYMYIRSPKFAGSNPAEAVEFLKGDKKSSAPLPSEGK